METGEFARNLLMPARRIEEELDGRDPGEADVLRLADRFGVSPLAVVIRLHGLGYP